MPKEIYISSTPHETRLAIVENDALTEVYYERENEYTLAGSIYNGRVTRVLPGMQSAFVDIGLERDAFLYITDFMEEAGDSADFEGEGGQRRNSRQPQTIEGAPQGERNRDRNGRGRRDRGRQSESEPQETQDSYEGAEAGAEESYSAEPREESAEVGEGAPGADGSRRWRGRRGRRRGRGQRDDARQQATAGEPQEPEAVSGDAYESSLEVDGAAEQELHVEAAASENDVPQESFNRGDRGGRNESRNDQRRDGRGRDDRGRGGRDRNGRRVPRGFAPRTSHYGLEDGYAAGEETQQDGPAPVPIILPGESLSKYRPAGEEPQAAEAAKAAPAVVAVTTAPGYVIPEGWDGGSVLPGESLSRHRNRPAASPVAAEPVAQAEVVAAEEAPVHSEVAAAEHVEYEPTEASVSYRVDPVAPSEFRQSAPVDEEPMTEVEEIVAEHTELPHAEIEQLEVPAAQVEELHHAEPVVEAAAQDVTEIHANGTMESFAPVIEPVEAEAEREAFEPGHVEEEAIDDEDYDTTMLHASSVEELDDLDEEETLEGAADLGTMLREMSIDEITRAGVEEDEEDDFEEEDAVDDGAHEAFAEDALDTETESEEADEAEYAEDGEQAAEVEGAPAQDRSRDSERRRGRRDGRRGRDRGRHSGGGDRERSGGGRGHHHSRSSMQATNLPAISELLKPGQEILVQIAKEPIAKKGARITSHIALPGRFLVFMPTVNHTGVSRKIESDGERRRLKEILLSEKGEAAGGFIVRTAAAGATEEELRSDLRFLLNLWADIKQRSESSKSPALIYHDLNLVERILRDQVTDNFSAIWVDSESDYERILRFLQRFQPSLIRRVKLYSKEVPLFEQFGITEEINKALRSKVWLKSGGSIVINQTEALVAIDINTGKYVGKTARLEDTIVKTNLDAIPEIVRQIRLRDLGGIIIIDFIDMDERKNRNRVMAALEEELKSDRAPSKILQFNDFGLVAITRKRVKQSLERTLSTQCSVCTGTGMVKSPVTVCNDIYIEMRKMAKHLDRGDVMLRVHPDVVKQLKSSTKWLQEMEEIVGKTILVKSDPSLHPEQFDIH